ncbi:FmdB family transcriptional regulator [Mycobacterium senriense]|uniref:FmdB family zinc ribbon protein n=1 Tax=Mycobacterium senriense TaxID=2775496 RepID=UPI001C7E6948|nr:FmdB family zinc ribbon protein [Mycobacterium senriense]
MPTYSYQCTECDDRFDIVQAFTDDALTTCKRCAGRLRKRFNSVGVVFKGSGFYRTDSRESSKKSSSSSNGSSSTGDSGSNGSGSSDKSGSSSSEKSSSSSSDKSSSSSTTSTAAATN